MYACIHVPGPQPASQELLALALHFSPAVEQTSPATVVFPIHALRTLIGSPQQIASEICRLGHERKFEANLAIASNPDTAILLALYFRGVTLVPIGEERFQLASIPLRNLFERDVPIDFALLEIFERWGLKTCEDLAALPERGVAERLGEPGLYLRQLASGAVERPLRISRPITHYQEHMELEHPLHLLEPLLFLLGRGIGELCSRLRSHSRAARAIEARLELENRTVHRCELEFPVPLDQAQTILKLLQLHLERHSPEAAVTAFTLRVEAAEPRRIQGDIFLAPTPPADKLQVTLARIGGLVGPDNVGTPMLLNTHRPDAFQMTDLNTRVPSRLPGDGAQPEQPQPIRLAMRLFRPALEARIQLAGSEPKTVAAAGVKGSVLRCAGPWKTSGEWWVSTAWAREEWDVALDDGALYRIYCELPARDWYVYGVYD